MAKKSSVKKTSKRPVKKVAKKATKGSVKKATKKATTTTPKKSKATVEKRTSRYINYIPKTLPAGKILCHGGMIPETPDQKPAVNGFRPWLDDDTQSEEYGPCNCGWSGLPHYMPLAWLESDRKKYDARKFPRR